MNKKEALAYHYADLMQIHQHRYPHRQHIPPGFWGRTTDHLKLSEMDHYLFLWNELYLIHLDHPNMDSSLAP